MTTLFKHLAVALAWLMTAGPALAATISTPSLNGIYSQSALGIFLVVAIARRRLCA